MATYKLISTVTVGSGGAASIDFTSIPATYADIKIVLSVRSNRATEVDDQIIIKPNSSTSNLSYRTLRGDGSTATSTTLNRTYVPAAGSTSSIFGNAEIYFFNYAGSTYKSFYCDSVQETNGTTAFVSMQAILWSDITAITSVVIAPVSGTNFIEYSSASLYGISST